MTLFGNKENGVIRVVYGLNPSYGCDWDGTLSNLHNADSRVYETFGGKTIVFMGGWYNLSQSLLEWPEFLTPKDKVDHRFLRNVFIDRCLGYLKKRKLLGDNDQIEPSCQIVLVSGGHFFRIDLSVRVVLESDDFLVEPLDNATIFLSMRLAHSLKDWDLLEQSFIFSAMTSDGTADLPLLRIDDQTYTYEIKKDANSPWEALSL